MAHPDDGILSMIRNEFKSRKAMEETEMRIFE